MGSVGFGEIALIAIVALLVFGPDRLPELSRKAGELLAKAREATRSFTDSLDGEFEDATSPIRTLQSEFQATKDEITSAAGTILDFSGQSTESDDASAESDDAPPPAADDASAESDDAPPPAADDREPE
jgi:Tat protein translocase TatB subunit